MHVIIINMYIKTHSIVCMVGFKSLIIVATYIHTTLLVQDFDKENKYFDILPFCCLYLYKDKHYNETSCLVQNLDKEKFLQFTT